MDKHIKGKRVGDYLFQSRKGKNKPLTRQAAYSIIKIAAEDCGVENVGTHTMRKTFGYHYYQKYKDIAMLMELFNQAGKPFVYKTFEKKAKVTQYRLKMIERENGIVLF